MSERPLFQNTDEQEAAYAPQETANEAAQDRAIVEEGTLGENRGAGTGEGGGVAPMPGPGATSALNPMGNISSSGSTSPIGRADAHDEDARDR